MTECSICKSRIKGLKISFIEGVGMTCTGCFDKDYVKFIEQEYLRGRKPIGEQECTVEIKRYDKKP